MKSLREIVVIFLLFYLELSGFLLYYENIGLPQASTFTRLHSLPIRVKNKFANVNFYSYICINNKTKGI